MASSVRLRRAADTANHIEQPKSITGFNHMITLFFLLLGEWAEIKTEDSSRFQKDVIVAKCIQNLQEKTGFVEAVVCVNKPQKGTKHKENGENKQDALEKSDRAKRYMEADRRFHNFFYVAKPQHFF